MSDIWDDLPPVHYDDGERFGTSAEMISEIKRLRNLVQKTGEKTGENNDLGPDFEAKARDIVDSFVNGELAPDNEAGLTDAISLALSEADKAGYERGLQDAPGRAEDHQATQALPRAASPVSGT